MNRSAIPDRAMLDRAVSSLIELEKRINEFNIFEAVGIVRREERHSDFLAFLLDPRQTHGLGGAFTRLFVDHVVACAKEKKQDTADLPAIIDCSQAEVRREWRRIDVLIVMDRLVVIIENKVDSDEHSGQLARYRDYACKEYPDRTVMGVFLTPDARCPKSDQTYVPMGYEVVDKLTGYLLNGHDGTVNWEDHQDLRTLLTHYRQMLRRHIMSESDIAAFCRQIYKEHWRAIDLIYRHKPDQRETIYDIVKVLTRATASIILDDSDTEYIRFYPTDWNIPSLQVADGWTTSKLAILFEFWNRSTSLSLDLTIAPSNSDLLRALLSTANALSERPNPRYKPPEELKKHKHFTIRSILNETDYAESTVADLEEKIRTKWSYFIANDLTRITEAIVAVGSQP